MDILISAIKVIFLILLFVTSAIGGRMLAVKNEKNQWLFFFICLLTGPVGLLFLFILIKIPQKFVAIFISIFIFLVLTGLYSFTTLLSGLEWGSIDFRFYLRDPSQASVKLEERVRLNKVNPKARKDIIIVGIDEATIREFSDQGIQWPF
ncbi:MAG TPA: hypothetical protein PKZ93_12695, partial [Spirochaetota bacterium]|nr:hypothetical protein [Spirochaetota bacterium]